MSGDGIRIIGRLATADGTGIVRMEDRFATGIDDLWSALVDPGRLDRWLGEFSGDLRLGGRFDYRFHGSGAEGTGRIEVCEPPRHLLVATAPTDSGGEHAIEAWLHADGESTVLVVEQRGLPIDLLAGYGAGIQIHVEDLAAHLRGEPRCDAPARWNELAPAYRQLAAEVG
jgi:uncharacterized protein YndB with AHSA1/START domain